MNLQDFRTKIYSILEKYDRIEKNGMLYYPEPAIIEAFEWLYENREKIEVKDLDSLIGETIERAFKKLER